MATNLNLDPRLVEDARRLGHHRTKREAVEGALREYIRRRACVEALSGFSSIEFDPAYDYKTERRRR
jgi:hypothetical protein